MEEYQVLEKNINEIQSVLARVESDDMNYDLNRQMLQSRRMSEQLKKKLQENGGDVATQASQYSDSSYVDKFRYEISQELLDDRTIAKYLIRNAKANVSMIHQLLDTAPSDAVCNIPIAHEFVEEEEKYMRRMESYIELEEDDSISFSS